MQWKMSSVWPRCLVNCILSAFSLVSLLLSLQNLALWQLSFQHQHLHHPLLEGLSEE